MEWLRVVAEMVDGQWDEWFRVDWGRSMGIEGNRKQQPVDQSVADR